MRPVIGITQCLDDRERWRAGRIYGYLDGAYAAAVEAAGGIPLVLPVQSGAAQVVELIDGLLLPGGDDFVPPNPEAYGPDVRFDPVPERQLAFDTAVLSAADARGLPVLGVCYGMQLLALRRGGSFQYHLPTDAPASQPHQLPEPEGRHAIEVTPGTKIAEILGPGTHAVNSLHHQAVLDPGQGLQIAAVAPDGVVEAIEGAEAGSGRLELGVQWHPEKQEGPAGGRLFEALVGACAATRRTR